MLVDLEVIRFVLKVNDISFNCPRAFQKLVDSINFLASATCETTNCVPKVVDGTNLLALAMKFREIIFIPTSVQRQIVVSCNNAAIIFLSNMYD